MLLSRSNRGPHHREYLCLATLYLIRESLTVSSTAVCSMDEKVAGGLPSLNTLTSFGYNKFTKATRALLHAIDRVMLLTPLHQVHV